MHRIQPKVNNANLLHLEINLDLPIMIKRVIRISFPESKIASSLDIFYEKINCNCTNLMVAIGESVRKTYPPIIVKWPKVYNFFRKDKQ